ncbi:MAG: lysophospholipid acyltransferase family protein [Leptospiraceae bacterium]
MNYRIRMLFAGIWAGIVTLLVFLISLVTWGRPFSAWLYARLLGGVGMRILGIKVRVEGLESMSSEPSVLMVNHQSNLDAFFMGSMYPRNTVVLAKREMLKVPLFGIILLASDNILVDREDASGAKKAVTDATNAIKKRGRHLWIFPEGTRSKGKGLGEFKKGAFIMAIAAQAPIVPIVNQDMGHLVNPEKRILKGGTHHVKVLPAIPTKGLRFRDADRLIQELTQLYHREMESF